MKWTTSAGVPRRGRKAGRSAVKFAVIRQTAVIDAPPGRVYEAYLDPKKHAEFTGSPATGSPKVGGKFTAGDGYISGRYTELKDGKKIVHEWKTTEWPAGYPVSFVELTFKPKGKGTVLTMVHSKVPADQADYYADGWKEYYWEPLRRYFKK